MKLLFPLLALGLAACAIPRKPHAAAVRTGTPVNGSVTRAWDAVVALYGDKNLPIRTLDRTSGIIIGDAATVTDKYANAEWYDCGNGIQGTNPARRAFINATVTGDSVHAMVHVTARWETWVGGTLANASNAPVQGGWDGSRWKTWVGGDVEHTWECTTQGGWESDFESQVKTRTEGR
jgi:hypothetical protein